jgi:hypothetical protein
VPSRRRHLVGLAHRQNTGWIGAGFQLRRHGVGTNRFDHEIRTRAAKQTTAGAST